MDALAELRGQRVQRLAARALERHHRALFVQRAGDFRANAA